MEQITVHQQLKIHQIQNVHAQQIINLLTLEIVFVRILELDQEAQIVGLRIPQVPFSHIGVCFRIDMDQIMTLVDVMLAQVIRQLGV